MYGCDLDRGMPVVCERQDARLQPYRRVGRFPILYPGNILSSKRIRWILPSMAWPQGYAVVLQATTREPSLCR